MTYHPAVQQIIALLHSHEAWFETFEHEPVRTSEEAARIRPEYTLHQGAKALIVKVKDATGTRFLMLVFPADQRFDGKKTKQILEVKHINFATEEEVSDITNGIQVGGVPPFGHLFHLSVFTDPSLFQNEKIVFNAGDRAFSIGMKSADYRHIVQPTIVEII